MVFHSSSLEEHSVPENYGLSNILDNAGIWRLRSTLFGNTVGQFMKTL